MPRFLGIICVFVFCLPASAILFHGTVSGGDDGCRNSSSDPERVNGDMDLLFAPGDACFPFYLGEKDVLSLKKGPAILRFRHSPQFSRILTPGVGYELCEVSVDANTSNALSHIFEMYRRRFPAIRLSGRGDGTENRNGVMSDEINKMYGFVYAKSIDVLDLQIGWRYNEQWALDSQKCVRSDVSRLYTPLRYSTYALDSDAMIAELFHSLSVPGLPVNPADTLEKGFRSNNRLPVKFVGDIKIVVVPAELIEDVQGRKHGCAEFATADGAPLFYILDRRDNKWVDCSKNYGPR